MNQTSSVSGCARWCGISTSSGGSCGEPEASMFQVWTEGGLLQVRRGVGMPQVLPVAEEESQAMSHYHHHHHYHHNHHESDGSGWGVVIFIVIVLLMFQSC